MPRPPRFIHPIRRVRDAIAEAEGKPVSQTTFAGWLGVSRIAIAKIENGTLGLSEDLARRIHGLTGAVMPSGVIADNLGDCYGEIDGDDYSPESWRQWKAHLARLKEASPDDLAAGLIQSVRLLAMAAAEKNRFSDASAQLYDAMRKVIEDLGLEQYMARKLTKMPKATRTMQNGEPHKFRLRWPIAPLVADAAREVIDAEVAKRWPEKEPDSLARESQVRQKQPVARRRGNARRAGGRTSA
jgi:hypothetical protein